MYIYPSYPSSEPGCTTINGETAQYKGKVFIGTILLPLEAAEELHNEDITYLLLLFFSF